MLLYYHLRFSYDLLTYILLLNIQLSHLWWRIRTFPVGTNSCYFTYLGASWFGWVHCQLSVIVIWRKLVSLSFDVNGEFWEAFMTWRLIWAIAIVNGWLISFIKRIRTIILLTEVTLSQRSHIFSYFHKLIWDWFRCKVDFTALFLWL